MKGRQLSSKRPSSYFLSFQADPPVLVAIRCQHWHCKICPQQVQPKSEVTANLRSLLAYSTVKLQDVRRQNNVTMLIDMFEKQSLWWKSGDKEYFASYQLKKKWKMMDFQGIHDRFIRESEFLDRMTEIIETKIFCRRWDALADEDHTHHLTAQEYFHLKNKWWLHSDKQGSNTMPLRHRFDFMQALSTLQRMQQEAGEEPRVLAYSYTHEQWRGTKFIFHMVELARFMVDASSFRKSRRRWTKRWVSGATCSLQYVGKFFGKTFRRWFTVTDGVVWTQHLKWPVFEMQKCAVIWNTKDFTIKEYSLATSTKVNYKIQKERNLYLVLRLRGDTEHDTNDNVTTRTQNTFNTAHMNTDTWVRSSLVC